MMQKPGRNKNSTKKTSIKKRVKTRETILKCFVMQEKALLIFLMDLLQEYLKLSIKQNKEQDLKYYLLNKCLKDYQ